MNRILYFDRFFDRIERNRNREIRQSKLKAELKRITDEAEITRQYERYKAELESLNPATVRRLSKEDELVEREKDRDVISEAALENLENLENPVSLTTINDNRDTIGFSRMRHMMLYK